MSSLEADLLLFIDALGQYEVAEEEDGIDEKVYVKSDNCLGILSFWKKIYWFSFHVEQKKNCDIVEHWFFSCN